MAVNEALYKQHAPHLKYMIDYAKMQYKADLTEVELILVPLKLDIAIGAKGNPAIYVHSKTMAPAINGWKERLTEYFAEHKDEVSKADKLEKGKAVLVKEQEKFDAMFTCGLLWHEFGHALNERVKRPNTEDNAFLFEIEMIDMALTARYFEKIKVTEQQIAGFIDSRREYYNKSTESKLKEIKEKLALLALKLKHIPIMDKLSKEMQALK